MDRKVATGHYEGFDQIREEIRLIMQEFLPKANLQKGDAFVVGCSSSEVASHKIGSYSSEEIGQTIFDEIKKQLDETGVFLAAQCCEHLNRALIVEREYALNNHLEIVSVVPKLKAGGSFATAAYKGFSNPVVVEEIKARAGMDIGDTLIGMHLKRVAVPVRVSIDHIGNAHVVLASTRPKFIGGSRACYE